MAAILKVLPQMLRQSTPVPGDQDILSGAKLGLHVRSRRFVRVEGPRPCKARGNVSALPAGPTERGGPPPLLGLSPRTVRSWVKDRLSYAPHSIPPVRSTGAAPGRACRAPEPCHRR
jgi:hypothetical protein